MIVSQRSLGASRATERENAQTRNLHNFRRLEGPRGRYGAGTATTFPAAADAPTLDELLRKISAIALDLLPANHPDVVPESLFLQITALREAQPAAG
jgi:hypothetical protein